MKMNYLLRIGLAYKPADVCTLLHVSFYIWLGVQYDGDVISSCQLFSAILWGKLCEMFVILTSVDVTFSIR